MAGVSIRVHSGAIHFVVAVLADSLEPKTWLAKERTNTYGGVYIWSDHGAMEAYKQTDIYKGMQANPHFENVTVTDFAVVESATRVTRGPAQAAA